MSSNNAKLVGIDFSYYNTNVKGKYTTNKQYRNGHQTLLIDFHC